MRDAHYLQTFRHWNLFVCRIKDLTCAIHPFQESQVLQAINHVYPAGFNPVDPNSFLATNSISF